MTESVVEEAGGEAGLAASPSVGACLWAAREAAGLKVADIAQTLKLGPRQVEALEKGDWHALPGPTFIRGVVRSYARLVALDSAPLMLQLDQILEKPVSVLALPETRPTLASFGASGWLGRDRLVAWAGLSLVLLAALAYFLLPSHLDAWREEVKSVIDALSRKDDVVQSSVPAAVPPAAEPVFPPGATPQQIINPQAQTAVEPVAPAAAAAPLAAQPVAPAEPPVAKPATPKLAAGSLNFVVDTESWIEVRDREGRVLFSQRCAPGTQPALDAQGPLSLVIGYAPGVKLYWRGQPVDLAPHARGEVARLVLE